MKTRNRMVWMMTCVLVTALTGAAAGSPGARVGDEPIVMREAVVVEQVASSGRVLLFTDAVEAMRVSGAWKTPVEGDEVAMPDGSRKQWKKAVADEGGWIGVRGGSYAAWTVESAESRVMILDAAGHGNVVVNGEIRTGDPYENGYVKVPVLIRKGQNELLFRGGRGRVRAKLEMPAADVYVTTEDMTMPDLVRASTGEVEEHVGAVMLVNASERPARVRVRTTCAGVTTETDPAELPGLSVRKVAVRLAGGMVMGTEAPVEISLLEPSGSGDGRRLGEAVRFTLAVVEPDQRQKRTFISDIDGSVQYYSVVPIRGDSAVPMEERGLVLSLHGASVEATSQAGAYAPKDWCHVVCPTNRRPFGFDWEDWGRLDAMEVLADAGRRFGHNDRRVYLTGHSMGGHGTWQLGAHFPDRFAAIAPSAGWSTFGSYGGGPPNVYENGTGPQLMLRRASSASDTLALARNYASNGVYILHGDADDNVPVSQARAMKKLLAEFHPNFAYYERAGAGHWWGNECVDWPALFEFFRSNIKPAVSTQDLIKFRTSSPSVSAKSGWVTIVEPMRWFEPSEVDLRYERDKGTVTGTTNNVAALSISAAELDHPRGKELIVTIDGQTLALGVVRHEDPTQDGAASMARTMVRTGEAWSVDESRDGRRTTVRNRGFKSVYTNRVVLVYGTAGSAEENGWSLAKAKYDAETFWYRGNGSMKVMSDTEYVRRRAATGAAGEEFGARNAVVYGSRDTNSAWGTLLAGSEVECGRSTLRVGDVRLSGEDLACLAIVPRSDHPTASVGIVAGTGLEGMRLTDRLPVFVSGVGVPDWVVLSTRMLRDTSKGVLGAGYFGADWTYRGGEAAWLEPGAQEGGK